jgi:crotonobetainyl-CoA:carnitine CoA-transferase CaiB-like acyl-CoA transferase
MPPVGALAGLRVVDLTSVVFGSYATQILGDLGADVIKIESPHGAREAGGDIMRWAGKTPPDAAPGLGPIFMATNRNKRSALIDLAAAEGRALLHKLVETADFFVTTVRAPALRKIGADSATLTALRPELIYLHGTGFASDGPDADKPAYDDLIQARCGLADLLSRVDGDSTPRFLPSLLGDKVSGLFLAQAALAGLAHKLRTGKGQFIEVPMLECLTSFNLLEHQFGHVFDPPVGTMGYSRITTHERRPYPTSDGFVCILPYTDAHWRRFFEVCGVEESVRRDPRFADYRARQGHADALHALVSSLTVTRTTQHWIDLLEQLQIPVARINRLEDLRADPQLAGAGFFEPLHHPHAGAYVATRPPIRFEKSPCTLRLHPPLLGEHTDEVRREAGLPQRYDPGDDSV